MGSRPVAVPGVSPAHRLAPVSTRRRKHWGWGYEDQQPTPEQARAAAPALAERLGIEPGELEQAVPLEALQLREPRIEVPAALAGICTSDAHARATHALGKSYVDVVRGFRGRFEIGRAHV